MLEKVFTPVFKAEDLHKQPNHHAITTVLMNGMPSSPFTMELLAPIGKEDRNVFESLREYSAKKYGRPGAEVDKEIDQRLSVNEGEDDDQGLAGGDFVENENGIGIDLGVARVPADQAIPGSREAERLIQQQRVGSTNAPERELTLEEIDAELARMSNEANEDPARMSNEANEDSGVSQDNTNQNAGQNSLNQGLNLRHGNSGNTQSGNMISLR